MLGNNSSLTVNGGRLRLNIASPSADVGSGVTANITGSSILELTGSTSALGTTTPTNRVAINNSSTAAAGLLVSASNQQVGGIGGMGNTQVNAGASLTADRIVQGSLAIGGTSGSHSLVTIDASDTSGNPLAPSSGHALDESLTTGGAFGVDSIGSGNSSTIGSKELAAPSLSDSTAGSSNLSPVPEPPALLLILVALSILVGQRMSQRRRARCRGF
jgi:hypothetical protein